MANCYTSKIIICRGVRSAVLVEIWAYMYLQQANARTPLFDLVPHYTLYSLAMSTLAIWSRIVRSSDVRSSDFSAPSVFNDRRKCKIFFLVLVTKNTPVYSILSKKHETELRLSVNT